MAAMYSGPGTIFGAAFVIMRRLEHGAAPHRSWAGPFDSVQRDGNKFAAVVTQCRRTVKKDRIVQVAIKIYNRERRDIASFADAR
jgi:hypothetical protein